MPLCLPQTLEVDSLMRANQCVSHLKVRDTINTCILVSCTNFKDTYIIHTYIVYCTYKKTVMLKPSSQYDTDTASVTSVMSVTGKGSFSLLNFRQSDWLDAG